MEIGFVKNEVEWPVKVEMSVIQYLLRYVLTYLTLMRESSVALDSQQKGPECQCPQYTTEGKVKI